MLQTGTTYSVGFQHASRLPPTARFAVQPGDQHGFNVDFTQPLLRNRGSYVTKLPITIARSRLRQSEYAIQDQILRLVANAETAYWEVISARENLRVQEQALALSDHSLKRSQRELELGAISRARNLPARSAVRER